MLVVATFVIGVAVGGAVGDSLASKNNNSSPTHTPVTIAISSTDVVSSPAVSSTGVVVPYISSTGAVVPSSPAISSTSSGVVVIGTPGVVDDIRIGIPFPLAQGFIIFRFHVCLPLLLLLYVVSGSIKYAPCCRRSNWGLYFASGLTVWASREALPPAAPFRSPNFTVHIQGPTPEPASPWALVIAEGTLLVLLRFWYFYRSFGTT